MTQTLKTSVLLILLAVAQTTFAQVDKKKALEKAESAVNLEDSGKYDEALKLLVEAQKLAPENIKIAYEFGYTYYLMKDYEQSLKVYKQLVKSKDADAYCYQMLGNVYDMLADTVNSMKAYDAGLKLFPKAGILYLEKGNVRFARKKYNEALEFYEEGIKADPQFPSNYYHACQIYCNSSEAVWGMIYGELFMNMERGTGRTATISKLLFDTYKSQIKYGADSAGKRSIEVDFCKNAVLDAKSFNSKKPKMPFGNMAYEKNMAIAAALETGIDINSLDRIRSGFINLYFKNGDNKTYPNVLFDYQAQIVKSGYMEAYNHWLLMKGDEDAFNQWQAANKEKWEKFMAWFKDNQIVIDEKHRFYSGQYD